MLGKVTKIGQKATKNLSNIARMNIGKNSLTKIAVVGPESTGKSTMSKFLAKEFDTLCIPEYARYYCKDLNNNYTEQDELNMFYGQLALEDAFIETVKSNIIICDTTILTVKIWSDHLFGKTPEVVLAEVQNRKYDYYLLMDIDLPWEHDPLRDFPNDRPYFLSVWKKELDAINANYGVISNLGEQRLQLGKSKCLEALINPY